MEILNLGGSFEPSDRSPKKKKLKVVIGIGLLAGVLGMGSTLAATITINTANNVEFGQGVSQATACDPAITLTPKSQFVNNAFTSDTSTGFAFSDLVISAVDNTACAGQYLIFSAYTTDAAFTQYTTNASGYATPLYMSWTYTSTAANNEFGGAGVTEGTGTNSRCSFLVPGDTSTTTNITCSTGKSQPTAFSGSAAAITGSAGAKTYTITFSDSYKRVPANAVNKITIESSGSAA